MQDIKRDLKHIKGLAKVLTTLAKEVEKKGHFDRDDTDLLKNVGSFIMVKALKIEYI